MQHFHSIVIQGLYSGSGKGIQGIRSDKVPEELWTEVPNIVQEAGFKTVPKKKKCKRAKWLSKEALKLLGKEEKLKAKEKR